MARSTIGTTRTVAGSRSLSLRDNVINGDFETAPTFVAAQTSGNAYINGSAAGSNNNWEFGWTVANSAITAPAQAQFDNTVSHSGTYSLKLDTISALGSVVCASIKNAGTHALDDGDRKTMLQLSGSTIYTLTAWVKTNNVATNGVFVDLREFNATGTNITTASSTKFSGTNNWTQVTVTVTTQPTTALGAIILRNGVAGNIGQAWFDDIAVVAAKRTVA